MLSNDGLKLSGKLERNVGERFSLALMILIITVVSG